MNQSPAAGKIDNITVLADPADIFPYLGKDKKTLVLFEMTGCPFCCAFQSRFIDFVEDRSGDCAFLRIKLDEYDNPLWEKYDLKAAPTVIVFSAGEIKSCVDAIPFLGISKKKWTAFCAALK